MYSRPVGLLAGPPAAVLCMPVTAHGERSLYDDLRQRIESYGVAVRCEPLGAEQPARFDGLSITVSPGYDLEARSHYLAHSLGSIAAWLLDPGGTAPLYRELREAKAQRDVDLERLERAVAAFCRFEERTSEYAVWLLAEAGHPEAIAGYTNFFRADLAAMAEFHRHGVAPVWREFLAAWNGRARRGEQEVRPFHPRPIPPFEPRRIELQEVHREEDGKS
jgi:putative component of membrane protein insertase Oxa1/YidC/SpoIIIJ protein YidD